MVTAPSPLEGPWDCCWIYPLLLLLFLLLILHQLLHDPRLLLASLVPLLSRPLRRTAVMGPGGDYAIGFFARHGRPLIFAILRINICITELPHLLFHHHDMFIYHLIPVKCFLLLLLLLLILILALLLLLLLLLLLYILLFF